MHLSKIVFSFFTISVGAVTAFHRGSTDSMLSMPRGGAGPIDADMAAKVCVLILTLSIHLVFLLQSVLYLFYLFTYFY